MRLTVTVVIGQPGGAATGTSRVFEGGPGTIGRGATCDWILPDPLSHLSKRHCVIAPTPTGFTVTDTSTNGVFVNGAPEPLGNGKTAVLTDGDRLGLGDYVLEVRMAAAEAGPRSPAALADDDPFGIAEFRLDRAAPAPPAPAAPLPTPEAPFEPFVDPARPAGGLIIPEDFDLLSEDGVSDSGAAHSPPGPGRDGPMRDDVPAQRSAFIPPRVEGSAIPEDWFEQDGAAAKPPAPARAPASELLGAFLAGAGLGADALAGQDPAAVMLALGKAYREAVLGIAEILRTRTMVKSEFHIEQTRIGAIGNNPLKFLADPEAVIAAMVGRPAPGFQEAGAAVREGVRDLKAHQLAMLAAMQIALTKLLTQFDPNILKSRLEKKSLLDAVVPGARKAKYWEVFEQSYKAIASELEEDFHGALGKAFAEAYEDEIHRL